MSRTKSQYARLLELDREIRAGKYPNSVTFARKWEVSDITVLRDIEYLRDRHDAPIAYDIKKRGYYYEEPNWYLPSLSISEGEALALLVSAQAAHIFEGAPLAEHLQDITRRILESLPERISVQPESLFTGMTFTAAGLKTVRPEVWLAFVRGLPDSRVVCADMQSGAQDERAGRHRFHPLHIANLRGDWFLFARIEPGDGIEQLSLARFSEAECTDETFYRDCHVNFQKMIRKSFRKAVFLDDRPAYQVRLRFCPPLPPVIQVRNYAPGQKLKKNRDGSLDMLFQAQSLVEVLWFVLEWGHGCTVLEPPELIALVMNEIEKLQSLYPKRPKLTKSRQAALDVFYSQTESRL